MTHSQSIRNVVVTSYVGAGKTSLVEALLFSGRRDVVNGDKRQCETPWPISRQKKFSTIIP